MKHFLILSVFFFSALVVNGQGLVILKQDTTKLYAAIVGKHQRDNVTKTELLAAKKLDLINNADSAYRIVSFQFLEACKGLGPVIFQSGSDKITNDMIWAFNSLSNDVGCKVYFEDIMCVGKNNDTIQVPSFLLYVVPEKNK